MGTEPSGETDSDEPLTVFDLLERFYLPNRVQEDKK